MASNFGEMLEIHWRKFKTQYCFRGLFFACGRIKSLYILLKSSWNGYCSFALVNNLTAGIYISFLGKIFWGCSFFKYYLFHRGVQILQKVFEIFFAKGNFPALCIYSTVQHGERPALDKYRYEWDPFATSLFSRKVFFPLLATVLQFPLR